jgi:hypothetical protein
VSNYTFETASFGLSDEGVHLLRSGYNYKTLPYTHIRKAILKKGVAIKNWLVVLVLGLALLFFAVYQAAHLYHLFMDPEVHRVSIESIVLPVLPLALGNYCMYISLKRTTILKIKYHGGKAKLPLRELVNINEGEQLVAYLQGKLGTRFSIEVQEAAGQLSTNIS